MSLALHQRRTLHHHPRPHYQTFVAKLPPLLSLGFSRKRGRSGVTGRVVCHSKGRMAMATKFPVTAEGAMSMLAGAMVISLFKSPAYQNSKLLALAHTSGGAWFLTRATQALSPLGYILAGQARPCVPWWPTHTVAWVASRAPAWTSACFLAPPAAAGTPPGRAVWCRSGGSRAMLLTPVFFGPWALFTLPSTMPKVLPNSTVFWVGCPQHAPSNTEPYASAAGLAVRFGRAPRVRGTVKNTCDHPNGGRSRALRLSRTPWGKPAKKSRPPRRYRLG